ncbi:MAG TPA: serine/threonine-protein kinase [Polyangia bacterium]|nr:serine/threonine-protein kinase [Polyangia bacterium]
MARPTPQTPDSIVGALIDDRWRVIERVGAGGMGVVYRAERIKLGKYVALKMLHEGLCRSKDFVSRFEREARAISRLDHIHCVSILDFGVHGRRPYFVMEFITGRRLTEEIDTPAMTPVRAVAVIRQVLIGLRHAHGQGVLHRDLKPDNVMLTEVTGTGDLVKILDFGFAHILDSLEPTLTDKQIVAGTPSYMSPEQASATKTDLRTDIYSTGVMLYELVVGKKPFYGDDVMQTLSMHIHKPPPPPRRTAPDRVISKALEDVILRALAKSRDERFQDAGDFLESVDGTPEGREASRPKLSVTAPRGEPVAAPPEPVPAAEEARPREPESAPVLEVSTGQVVATRSVSRSDRRPARRGPVGVVAGVLLLGAGVAGALVARSHVAPAGAGAEEPAATAPASPLPAPSAAPPVEPRPLERAPEPAPTPAVTPPAEPVQVPAPEPVPAQAPAPETAPPPPRDVRSQAESLTGAGRLNEAERILLRERRARPQAPWVHMDLADIYFRRLWRRDAVREWDEALKLEPSLRRDRTLQQHLCGILDRDISDAERLLETRFAGSAAAPLVECIKTTHDRETLHNAAQMLERLQPTRLDRGLVATRELELSTNCEDRKLAVQRIILARDRHAIPALQKLERARTDKNGRPVAQHACLGTVVRDALRTLGASPR